MLITAITQQKRDPSRYNIFIDGVYAFALPMQDILYFKLKEGQEAAEETIAFIRKNLIYIKAQDTACVSLATKCGRCRRFAKSFWKRSLRRM